MKSFINFSFLSFSLLILSSCFQNDEKQHFDDHSDPIPLNSDLKFAKNFLIKDSEHGKELKVLKPWNGSNNSLIYKLVPNEKIDSLHSNDSTTYIGLPINRIVCLSTTHLGFLSVLNAEKYIVGISGTRWTHNNTLRNQVDSGYTKEVGMNMSYDYETIVQLNPDVVFAFGIDQKSAVYIKKLQDLGIKVVIVSEFMEHHPLGKAEWIKFFASFTGDDSIANSFFKKISSEYMSWSEKALATESKPSVFTGLPWKGDWFVPGGASFQAKLLHDAGANYIWQNNNSTSGMIVDIESVFQKALEADYWLNLNDLEFKDEIENIDPRYKNFNAFRMGNLYNNNARKNTNSGNDYWESGVVRPDLVLQDLIRIFHPDIAKDHHLFYYHQLN